MTRDSIRSVRLWPYVSAFVFLLAAGCSQYIDPDVPEPIRPFVEPEFGGEYLLYRPSSYDREQAWPLIVACHSSFPDSPNRQIRDWTELAERYGFLVVAPRLKGSGSSWTKNAAQRSQPAQDDETHILATIRHVRAGHTISEDRILIHGWSDGARAALQTGLRNPTVFRAISLTRPDFDESDLAGLAGAVDPYQPVYVNFDVSDALTGKHGRRCVDALRAIGANLREDTTGHARRSDGQRAVEFFQNVIRKEPWLHIRASASGEDRPLETRFSLLSSHAPKRYRWEFGDGDQSPVAAPVHAYAKPGTYRVTLTVEGPQGTEHRRTLDVTVPWHERGRGSRLIGSGP